MAELEGVTGVEDGTVPVAKDWERRWCMVSRACMSLSTGLEEELKRREVEDDDTPVVPERVKAAVWAVRSSTEEVVVAFFLVSADSFLLSFPLT